MYLMFLSGVLITLSSVVSIVGSQVLRRKARELEKITEKTRAATRQTAEKVDAIRQAAKEGTMPDSESDHEIPGLIEYVSSRGIVDSVVNRKSYRLAYIAGRMFNDALGMETGFCWVYSNTIKAWAVALCRVLPGDVYVPLMLVHQEEFGELLKLSCCDDPNHSCPEFGGGSKPSKDGAETFAAFLPLVQSLYGDPAIPDSEQAQKLSELYISQNQEKGEGDGKE